MTPTMLHTLPLLSIQWLKSPKLTGGGISLQYTEIVTSFPFEGVILLGTHISKFVEPKGAGTRSKIFNMEISGLILRDRYQFVLGLGYGVSRGTLLYIDHWFKVP